MPLYYTKMRPTRKHIDRGVASISTQRLVFQCEVLVHVYEQCLSNASFDEDGIS
jgi:hypothetical protein